MNIKIQSYFLSVCTLLFIVEKCMNKKKKSKPVFFLVLRIRSVPLFKNLYQFSGLNTFDTLDSFNYGHFKSELLV